VGEGHQEGEFGEAKAEDQELNLQGAALHEHQGFAEIALGVLTGLVCQGDKEGTDFGPALADILPDGGLTPGEAVFRHQAMVDTAGGVALLGRALPVLSQPLIDDGHKGAQDGLGSRLPQGVAGGSGVSKCLAHGAPVIVSLSGNLPDAFAFDKVVPANLLPLVHL
jgi:hypothetical protein